MFLFIHLLKRLMFSMHFLSFSFLFCLVFDAGFFFFFACVRVCMCENIFESIIPIATLQIDVNDKNLQYKPKKSFKITSKIQYTKVQKFNHLMIMLNS